MKRLISTCILGIIVSCAPQEPPSPLYGRKISHLDIRWVGPIPWVGQKSVYKDSVRALIKSQPGTELNFNRMDDDVRTLYESGRIDDMKFLAEPDGQSVRLIAEITNRPACGPLLFVGNTGFSDMRLVKATHLKPQSQLTREDLRTACREIETFYHNNGYPDAKVTVTSFKGGEPVPDDFNFRIEEGPKAGR